jgi:glycosyltransferase involved in cell wall biosynthesis
MACGTPVVTSNVSSLPEVVGDAALLVDPTNVVELAEAVFQVLTDQAMRQTLIAKGLERARQFTWEEAAEQMVAVYHQVVSG